MEFSIIFVWFCCYLNLLQKLNFIIEVLEVLETEPSAPGLLDKCSTAELDHFKHFIWDKVFFSCSDWFWIYSHPTSASGIAELEKHLPSKFFVAFLAFVLCILITWHNRPYLRSLKVSGFVTMADFLLGSVFLGLMKLLCSGTAPLASVGYQGTE